MTRRRALAAVANGGLAVAAVGLAAVLGTGGTTTVRISGRALVLNGVYPWLQLLAVCGVLRLAVASRAAGLEGRLLAVFARAGLPPRDAPATRASAAATGLLLGAAWGLAAAVADALRVALVAQARGGLLASFEAAAGLGLATLCGTLAGAVAGAAAGLLSLALGGAGGRHAGRYETGRRTAALLALVSPLAVLLGPAGGHGAHAPWILLPAAAAFAVTAALLLVVVPLALVRARDGRFGAVILVGVTALILAAVAGNVWLGAAGTWPHPRSPEHPNVLLVTITGLRADAVGAYRSGAPATPQFDRLAQRGVLLREAITPSSDEGAAAASLLTGLYPAAHGLRGPGEAVREDVESLPERLAFNGYRTAAFVSARRFDGRATGFEGLFEAYADQTAITDWMGRTTFGAVPAWFAGQGGPPAVAPADVVGHFGAWLGARSRGPWFVWVELAGPAWPEPAVGADAASIPVRVAPAALGAAPRPAPGWANPRAASLSLAAWFAGYEAAVRASDAALRELLDVIDARGETQRTYVVVTAERGTTMGEDGTWFEAGAALVEPVIRVPLLVSGPGVAANAAVPGPCSLVDVAPTLFGLLALGGDRRLEGEDLSRYLTAGRAADRDPHAGPVFAEALAPGAAGDGRLAAARLGTWKLLRWPDGVERLREVGEGAESDLDARSEAAARLQQDLSDVLTRRLAEEARAARR